MVGGIERPAASMGGGFILGILITIGSTYINPLAADWFPFVVVIAVLLIAPNGVFRTGAWRQFLSTRQPGPQVPVSQDHA
jgi:branched-subunit amino acid ABC-type transport system permease component